MSQGKNKGFVEILVLVLFTVFAVVVWRIYSHKPPQSSIIAPVPSPTLFRIPTPTPSSVKQSVLLEVPFVSQAPTGNWRDLRQEDGCEEAAAYMAYLWATGKEKPKTPKGQEKALLDISNWEEKTYGSFKDTNTTDTAERILRGHFGFEKFYIEGKVNVENIKQKLSEGNLIIAPLDGRKLGNPYYTAPGPERHNLVILGYDDKSQEFITNDNGTKRGKGYRYKYDLLVGAIRDYPTGDHLLIIEDKKSMIIVEKE